MVFLSIWHIISVWFNNWTIKYSDNDWCQLNMTVQKDRAAICSHQSCLNNKTGLNQWKKSYSLFHFLLACLLLHKTWHKTPKPYQKQTKAHLFGWWPNNRTVLHNSVQIIVTMTTSIVTSLVKTIESVPLICMNVMPTVKVIKLRHCWMSDADA